MESLTKKSLFEFIFNEIGANTKKIAKNFGVTTEEAYKVANQMSKQGVLYGDLSNGNGMSVSRGNSRRGFSNGISLTWYLQHGHPEDYSSIEEYCKEHNIDLNNL